MAAEPTTGIHTPRGTAFFKPGVGYVVPGADYWTVKMGPCPGEPEWHQEIYKNSETPFPSEASAHRFAAAEKEERPDRSIVVVYPDGYVFDLDTPMKETA